MEVIIYFIWMLTVIILFSQICYYFEQEKKIKNKAKKFGIEEFKLNYREIIRRVDQMTGRQFEEFFVFLLNSLGHYACVTKATGDFGADSVIIIDNLRIVAQAKRCSKNVGGRAIQEVLGAIKPYHADRGLVITNRFFTQNAEKLAKSNNIELWDRNTLIELIEQAQSKLGFR